MARINVPKLAKQVVFVTGGAFTPRASAYLTRVENLQLENPFEVANFIRIVGEFVRGSRRVDSKA